MLCEMTSVTLPEPEAGIVAACSTEGLELSTPKGLVSRRLEGIFSHEGTPTLHVLVLDGEVPVSHIEGDSDDEGG